MEIFAKVVADFLPLTHALTHSLTMFAKTPSEIIDRVLNRPLPFPKLIQIYCEASSIKC